MKKSKMSATSLRIILIVTIVLLIGSMGAGFYFAQKWLNNYAIETKSNSTSGMSASDIVLASNKYKEYVNNYQTMATKADSFSVVTANIQSQTMKDVDKYASITGVTVSNYNFSGSNAIITIKNPVKFTNFIQFLKLIENNLPKMQPNGVEIKYVQGSSDNITVEPLTIKLFTR